MKEADDALIVLARTRAALKQANKHIDAVRDCDAHVRKQFSTGGVL